MNTGWEPFWYERSDLVYIKYLQNKLQNSFMNAMYSGFFCDFNVWSKFDPFRRLASPVILVSDICSIYVILFFMPGWHHIVLVFFLLLHFEFAFEHMDTFTSFLFNIITHARIRINDTNFQKWLHMNQISRYVISCALCHFLCPLIPLVMIGILKGN